VFERWCLIPVFVPSSSAPSCAVRATLDLRRSYFNAWGVYWESTRSRKKVSKYLTGTNGDRLMKQA